MFVQQEVGKLIMTAIDYPPMQKGASFNLDAVKAKVEAAMAHHGQWPERQPKKGQEFLALLLQDARVCQVE